MFIRRTCHFPGPCALGAVGHAPAFAQAYPVKPRRRWWSRSAEAAERTPAAASSPSTWASAGASRWWWRTRSAPLEQIGADLVAKSKPDGYTLLLGNIGTQAINPAVPQAALRRRQGLCASLVGGRAAAGDDGESIGPGEDGGRIHRAGQGARPGR